MTRLRDHARLKLCFTPLYKIASHTLKCVFNNIRSLKKNSNELFLEPNVLAADIVCLVETWLTPIDTFASVQHAGYQLIRADGHQAGHTRPHRGIAAYFKQHIEITNSFSVITPHIEMLLIELCYNELQVLIATIYKAPLCTQTTLETFLIEKLLPKCDMQHLIIIQGDFNIGLLHCQSTFPAFMENRFSCVQQVLKCTHNTASLIDHIYANIQSLTVDVIECIWSDHSILYWCFLP